MHAFRINVAIRHFASDEINVAIRHFVVAIRHFASDEISVTLNDFCSDINLSWQRNFNWIFEKILAYLVFGNFELAKMSSFQGMITFWGLPRLAERLSAPWIEKNSTSITMLKINLVEYFGLSDPDLLLNKKMVDSKTIGYSARFNPCFFVHRTVIFMLQNQQKNYGQHPAVTWTCTSDSVRSRMNSQKAPS